MTEHIHSLTVVLEADVRDDDLEPLIQAIGMLRGVLTVSPHVADATSYMAESRARALLGEQIWAVLYPKTSKS